MTTLLLELLRSGGLAVIASLLTFMLSNRQASSMNRENKKAELELAKLAAENARELEDRKALHVAFERRYEDKRDALLGFQNEVLEVIRFVQMFEEKANEIPVGEEPARDLIDMRLVTLALNRAMALSDVSTAERAEELQSALVYRIKNQSVSAENKLSEALNIWRDTIRAELQPERQTPSADNQK